MEVHPSQKLIMDTHDKELAYRGLDLVARHSVKVEDDSPVEKVLKGHLNAVTRGEKAQVK